MPRAAAAAQREEIIEENVSTMDVEVNLYIYIILFYSIIECSRTDFDQCPGGKWN